MTQPYAALLNNRGVVRIGGAGRQAFLQGLISNDMRLCADGQAIFAALLTPQGKFLHDLFIVENGDSYLIDCESARADDLLQRLAKYKLRAKVTLENVSENFEVWGIFEPSFPSSFRRKPESSASDSEHISHAAHGHAPLNSRFRGNDIVFFDPRLPELGLRMIAKKNQASDNFQSTDFAAYDEHRLRRGVTDGSRDMLIEKSTLPEGNCDFLNGISWDKGCYMGQELTARMHYRGLVKKRLFPVAIEGAAPASGTIVKLNSEDVGEMRSSHGKLGLALLNVEKAKLAIAQNTRLACETSMLTASQPNWMKV